MTKSSALTMQIRTTSTRDISFKFNYGIIQRDTNICRAAAYTITTITVAYEAGCYMPDWDIVNLNTGEVMPLPPTKVPSPFRD